MKRYAVASSAVRPRLVDPQISVVPCVFWAISAQDAQNQGLLDLIKKCPPSAGWTGYIANAVEIPDTEETLKLWGGKNA